MRIKEIIYSKASFAKITITHPIISYLIPYFLRVRRASSSFYFTLDYLCNFKTRLYIVSTALTTPHFIPHSRNFIAPQSSRARKADLGNGLTVSTMSKSYHCINNIVSRSLYTSARLFRFVLRRRGTPKQDESSTLRACRSTGWQCTRRKRVKGEREGGRERPT